jgi:hypothetical protein
MNDKDRYTTAATDPGSTDAAVDLSTIARDDVLLTALGRDEPMPDGDEIAALLAAWRNDLRLDELSLDQESSVPESLPDSVPDLSTRRRGWSRQTRGLIAAAAAVVLLTAGVTVAAGDAGPGSPLWPITTIVYGERADSLIAQQDTERGIQQARDAIAEARYTEAGQLLDAATARAADVRDQSVVRRLLDQIAAVRGLLPGGIGLLPTAAPTAPPSAQPTAPGQTAPTPAPTSAPSSGGGLPLPLPLPSLPVIPLPTLPVLPLPTLSLPPLFP